MKVKKIGDIFPDDDMTKYFVGEVIVKKIVTRSDSDEVELYQVQFYNGVELDCITMKSIRY